MAKELPFWKFYPSEYLQGDITLCSMKAQGVFSNICSYYWLRDCDMTLESIQERFSKYPDEVQELINKDVIKVVDDSISILFLNEQRKELDGEFNWRSRAGKKGMKSRYGYQCYNNDITEDKDKDKDKDKKIRTRKKKPEEVLVGKLNNNPETKIHPKFRKVFLLWLEYKRERRESYKTLKSTYMAYEKLYKFAGGDPKVAMEIIKNSMSNNYAGFFELPETLKKNTVGSRRGKSPKKTYRKPDIEL